MRALRKHRRKHKIRKKKVFNTNKILIMVSLLLILTALIYVAYNETKPAETTLKYTEFIRHLENNEVEKVSIIKTEDTFNVYMKDSNVYSVINPDTEDFKKELLEKGVDIEIRERTVEGAITNVILLLPSTALMVLFGLFIYKQLNGSTSRMFKVIKNENRITFKDVAGIDDVKEEVEFAVETLKNYKSLYRAGARPIKGILLEGEAGVGKTLIAKAIAGEANVPFIGVNGSDFIEMFAGMGASRVRALWSVAQANAPCVVFIDEIDAIGVQRSQGMGASSLEHNQTINALLEKLDGLTGDSGILVIGATNRLDTLDKALVRAGRFDKVIHIGLPSSKESRDEIIRVHLKNKKLENSRDFDNISKLMYGLSGASIESCLNEAVMLSIRDNRKGVIRLEDVDRAVMKQVVRGTIVRPLERDRYITAVHETGHAIMMSLLGRGVYKVSITAYSSGIGGLTVKDVDTEINLGLLRFKSDIETEVKILLGGLIAEKIIFGETSTGSSSDIQRARELIDKMVSIWGMKDNPLIEQDTKALADSLYDDTFDTLMEYKHHIESLSERLLKEETIYGYSIDKEIKNEHK